KSMIARLFGAMLFIEQDKEPRVEKNLLGLPLADIVFVRALSAIAIVPVKSECLPQVEHICILTKYTETAEPYAGGRGTGAIPPVCRSASPAAMAAATATLSERRPGRIGIVRRASAAAWTASGTPADSRPNSRMSSAW